MEDTEEDPVIAEYDVHVNVALSPFLHLVHYPSNVADLEMARGNSSLPIKGRYKKKHQVLELDYPLNPHTPYYSRGRGQELAMASQVGRAISVTAEARTMGTSAQSSSTAALETIKMVGNKVQINEDAIYFVATFQSETGLILTPIERLLSLRPSLKYLDESDAKTKVATRRMDLEEEGRTVGPKAVQVQFKKRETEEQAAARLSSFAHLQRQLEDEAWISLTHFLPGSVESETVAARLISDAVLKGEECVGE